MKTTAWIAALFLVPVIAQAMDLEPVETPGNHYPVRHQEGRRVWVSTGGFTSLKLARIFGGMVESGYEFGFLGAGFRYSMATAKFRGIFGAPGYPDLNAGNEFESSYNPNAELNRVRTLDDQWSFKLFQPFVTVHAKAFPYFLPLLSQKGRFGVSYAMFNDAKNSLNFRGYIATAEGALQYALGSKSRFSIELYGSMNWGEITEMDSAVYSHQHKRLPVSFVTWGVSFLGWI
ncbi:MAG: hypothetical protein A2583_08625 [Bdellovibrionales bacterium RIFOXYD1_FULL_53_11]|nr:MAG: hypothetical protein A2583_08625 [Bdellovibrionales bacterium RIFOXYD1_FULL_53_11]